MRLLTFTACRSYSLKMIDNLIARLRLWFQTVETQYNVNPVVFLILLLCCAPFFYYAIYRIIKALALKRPKQILVWATVFLCATALPYLYVMIFGQNLPWWTYGIFVLLIVQSIISLILRLSRKGKTTKT